VRKRSPERSSPEQSAQPERACAVPLGELWRPNTSSSVGDLPPSFIPGGGFDIALERTTLLEFVNRHPVTAPSH
jgi:hypothetical protein